MKVPILLYIDHEEVGQVESITLNVEPDVGVVMSITRETRVETKEIPEEEEDMDGLFEEELSDEALEEAITKSVDDRLPPSLPSSGGVLPLGKMGVERIVFSEVDILELQKVSLLRIHPKFFT